MSEQSLVPVHPARDEKGRLKSLFPFVGETDEALPYPAALSADDTSERKMIVNFFRTSASMASKLGILGSLSSSSDYLDDAAVYEILVGVHKIRAGDVTDAFVLETFWGSSIRIAMRVKTMDAKATGGFSLLAASVELGTAQVEYQVTTLGSVSPTMLATALEGIPLFGTLTFDAYTQFTEAAETIAHSLMTETSDPAVPVAVRLKYHPAEQSLLEAMSTRYAMIQLAHKKPLKDALQGVPAPIDPLVIQHAYRRILGQDPIPLEVHAERARRWLNA